MMKPVCFLSIVAFILPVFCVIPADGTASTSTVADKSVGPCHIENFGAVAALQQISERARIPIGVEAVIDYKKEPTIVFDFPGGTVADLLNLFVSQAPDYTWGERGGIIHVFRSGKHLPLADVVLEYPAARDKTRRQIWEYLGDLPEITAWLNSNHCSLDQTLVIVGPGAWRIHNDPISIEPRVMTLRDLLDEAALKSGENFWAIVQSPPNEPCTVSISL